MSAQVGGVVYLFLIWAIFSHTIVRPENVVPSLEAIAGLASAVLVAIWVRVGYAKKRRVEEVIASAARIPVYAGSLPSAFNDELNRARRYQHSLTLIVVTPSHPTFADNPIRPTSVPVSHPVLGCILRSCVRESDLLAYHSGTNRYVALLVQVDQHDAIQCVNRMDEEARQRTGIALQVGVASFPQDALTLEDLMNVALLSSRSETATAALPTPLQRKATAAMESRSPKAS